MENNYKIFIYADKLTNQSKLVNFKYKNLSVIYRDHESTKRENLLQIVNFCKSKRISLFLNYNLKHTKNIFYGIYIPSYIKNFIFTNKIKIGSAHNYKEIFFKIRQQCKLIFLSPIFEDLKNRKSLGIVKFNLLSKNFKVNFIALGGINYSDLNKVFTSESVGIAGIRMMEDLRIFRKTSQTKLLNN
jgi:thiamine monophosphate synthase